MYDPFTGALLAAASPRTAAVELGLEPPRFCARCGRRMVVQIAPDGWWARCSRHGVRDSRDGSRR
ncbi:hypothetical protein [Rhodococcus sp. HNM0569]|uniref:biotin synthase auxiliary protein BsaP n=1 Tax=Rhodococcus sp. HNM0569 TaxID=2716340 RepID=UPI00146F5531|nr:hypothetical protein [Rhodococcus sp. HNM0569]NLU82960.1 hypothetical protein [Rhodococcus sp. HNM0569]